MEGPQILPTGPIGIVSDTHARGDLPRWLTAGLGGVGAILHAGDVVAPEALAELAAVAPVFAVRGNNDAHPWPLERIFAWQGKRILLLHGHRGGPTARGAARARSGDADIVVYGHSHRPENTVEGDVLFVNPGSPTQPRGSTRQAAILTMGEEGPRLRFFGPGPA